MENLTLASKILEKAWSSDIGSGSTNELPLTAQPIVTRSMVFTLNTSAEISAFDTAQGGRLWQTDIMSEDEDETVIGGGLAFADGLVYATNGFDEILALRAENGEIVWRSPLPAASRAAPTVINNRVFVSTQDNRLIAFDAANGDNLWEYAGIGEMAGLLGMASPAANSDIVVPSFSSGEITALRVENGSVAWSDNLSNVRNLGGGLESLSDIKALPVMANGLVIAMSVGGKLAALNEVSGMRVWQRDIGGSQTPWAAGEYLFVLSSENQLISLTLQNGGIIWIKDLPRYETPEKKKGSIRWSGPVMANNRLYLAGSHGILMEIDAQNGNFLREIRTKKAVRLSPVIAAETLYLLAEDGTLMAFR
jgi:outer membrane protein assembly factor BamB